ncbi:hypothetical protein QN400_07100 [Pseudomonas sp. RTC3]|uniref:hypothetical protein n=1 Tax=unclassified Pseudomonas TaxID=196821 RepID=UPI002AB4B54A|nr:MULTISPECIES: hypothetical protein [unclassified Pseudomonas]MEB0061788.1 hypothetical protein [Pseudomonas sp. RTC3]MDY7565315.1 hypothetical protein [Pseudomonas sp. 5C2]MEB0008791.1 hypothetical protein [Pseudomonas sp. RTB2]MEB0019596.1 hypothetical protein [Pseudomonas sp. RTB3]MEB0027410.1 hypothetical protein [Pseudomonas sp. MH9.2]
MRPAQPKNKRDSLAKLEIPGQFQPFPDSPNSKNGFFLRVTEIGRKQDKSRPPGALANERSVLLSQTVLRKTSTSKHFDYDSPVCPVGLSSTALLKNYVLGDTPCLIAKTAP